MKLGLLDLPAPLWNLLDQMLAAVGLPPALRVLIYAIASAWLCMALYRRLSRQQELGELSAASKILRAELAGYDGPFDGLMSRVQQLMRLSMRHLGLSFGPALACGLPLLFLLPWLSNHFGSAFPAPGTLISVGVDGHREQLTWSPTDLSWNEDIAAWQVPWPQAGETMVLRTGEQALLTLPTPAPSTTVHQRIPLFNLLIGNPAGYLPVSAAVNAVHLNLPDQQLLPFGPQWLRGWLAVYFGAMVLWSLWLKWRWKLQ